MTYLDELYFEKVDPNVRDRDFEETKNQIDSAIREKANKIIQINDVSLNRLTNIYALMRLFEVAKKEVRIFTTNISDEIYGMPQVMWAIESWLADDSGRKLRFIVKDKDFDIYKRHFRRVYNNFPVQVSIRKATIHGLENCILNTVIADNLAYKIKEDRPIGVDQRKETVILNYRDEETSQKLAKLFDRVYSSAINIFPWNKMIADRAESFQKAILDKVSSVIHPEIRRT